MTYSIHLRRRKPICFLVQAGLAFLFSITLGHAAVTSCIVSTATDDPATASATVTATTASGTLRDCIIAADLLTGLTGQPTAGMTIRFATGFAGVTLSLANDLPLLFNNAIVDASALSSPITIDGGQMHRIFFISGLPSIPLSGLPDADGAQAIAVTLKNLVLQNGLAKGGDSSGGAGMGAGAALFVNKFASVTLDGVQFSANVAQGGVVASALGGGGGGMGNTITFFLGGSGLCSGANSDAGAGIGTGGTAFAAGGWGGQGLGQISNAQGFNSADFDVDSGAGTGGQGLIGGGGSSGSGVGRGGGFGGGGGGGNLNAFGAGGFGGGGGASSGGGANRAGAGGFGGGGGFGISGGYGGFGGGGGGGGSTGGVGATFGDSFSGAGASFGGAVFVRAGGSLLVNSAGVADHITGGSVVSGSGGAAAAGSGMFLMSGVSTTFNIAGSYSITDTLADDSAATLPAGHTYTPGSGSGAAIIKQGNGTLILSGANSYAGATTISAGIVRVAAPGSINASATTIAATGTLTGDGSVGLIDSSGTLAPGTTGNPQAAVSLNGTLKLEPGSLTCFHASGASNAVSALHATGAATINGIARIDFNGGPSVGTTYTLLNAASVSGSFAGFETNMPNLDGSLSYSSTAVTFTVTASDVLFQNGFEQSVSDSSCVAAFAN